MRDGADRSAGAGSEKGWGGGGEGRREMRASPASAFCRDLRDVGGLERSRVPLHGPGLWTTPVGARREVRLATMDEAPHRGDGPARSGRRTPGLRWCCAFGLLPFLPLAPIPALFVALVVYANVGPSCVERREFEPDVWKEERWWRPPDHPGPKRSLARMAMLDDLRERHLVAGTTEPEVRALLGAPDSERVVLGGRELFYVVGPGSFFPGELDVELLVVSFDHSGNLLATRVYEN